MRNSVVFPGQGITHLIIEEAASDARVYGASDTAEIQVRYTGAGPDEAPQFIPEGVLVTLEGAAASRVDVPATLAVTIRRAAGDLCVEGLTDEVNLPQVEGDLLLRELAGTVCVAAVHGDLRALRVADLQIAGRCSGDMHFEEGHLLAAEAVGGDLRIQSAKEVRVGRVRGDLWIEEVQGPVQVAQIDGDARLTGVGGLVALEAVAGDLRATALTGGLSATHVSGDAAISGPFAAAEGYAVSAAGDVSLNLPADADARLAARAGGRIRSDLKLMPSTDGSPTFTATLGQGAGQITVSSGGDLRIRQAGAAAMPASAAGRRGGRPMSDDLSDLGERIRQQVSASLAAHGINIEAGELNWSRGRSARPARPVPPERPHPPAPPAGPATDEERAVLKMVEEGKITAAEADKLLQALGA